MSTADIRSRVKMSDADLVEHFSRLGFDVRVEELTYTTETVEDFLQARDTAWHRPGDVERYEAKGIPIVKASPTENQPA